MRVCVIQPAYDTQQRIKASREWLLDVQQGLSAVPLAGRPHRPVSSMEVC